VPLCGEGKIVENMSVHLSSLPNRWKLLKTFIDLHMHRGLPVNNGNVLSRSIARWYGPEAMDFILQYNTPEELVAAPAWDYYHSTMGFMDVLIAYGTLASLKRCLRAGLPIPQNTFYLTISMTDGDGYEDMKFGFTTDYICLSRYGLTAADLQIKAQTLETERPTLHISHEEDNLTWKTKLYTCPPAKKIYEARDFQGSAYVDDEPTGIWN
jgi:hypothetical protein